MAKTITAIAAALFLSTMPAGAQTAPAPIPNYFMLKLNVADLQKSLGFYTGIIGLKEVRRSGGANGAPVEVILSESGRDLESQVILVDQRGKGPFALGSGLNVIAFILPDVRGVMKRAVDAQYKVTSEARDIKRTDLAFATGITVGFITDPDGYNIELIQWTR